MAKLTIARAVKVIGIPLSKWPGKCATIADAFLKHKLVKGKSQYGHYFGEIHPESHFKGRSFTHHAWILDGNTIIDPTRWVFEAVEPYIYYGKPSDEYDFGGNGLRKSMMGPAPANDPVERQFVLAGMPKSCLKNVFGLLPGIGSSVSVSQMFWIANLPLDMLGKDAKPLYMWLKTNRLGGFIPIDNKRHVLDDSD